VILADTIVQGTGPHAIRQGALAGRAGTCPPAGKKIAHGINGLLLLFFGVPFIAS
jgi:hypothetical protein